MNSELHAEIAKIWLPVAFQKDHRHTHQNPLKSSPVSERSANPLQNYFSFCFFFFFGFVCLFVFFLFFFWSPRGFLQSTARPHPSTTRPLERAASHIKVTCPPCLFQLPPWENVNRSTTLIHRMWVMSSYQLLMREIMQFRQCCVSYLKLFSFSATFNQISMLSVVPPLLHLS